MMNATKKRDGLKVWGDILSLRLTAAPWCPSGGGLTKEEHICWILWLNSLVTSVCGSVRCIWVPRYTVHQPHLLPLGHHAVPWNRNQENKNITHLHWFNSANVRPPFSQKGKDPGIKGCNFSFIGWDLIVLFTDDPRLHILTNSVQS